MSRLAPPLALITGASSGIGKALARKLAEENYNLLIHGRNKDALQALKEELEKNSSSSCEILQADLSLPQDRAHFLGLLESYDLDLVINNAGLGIYGDPLDYPLKKSQEQIEVNMVALCEISLSVAKKWKAAQKPGTFLNIGSVLSHLPYPNFSLYSTSKIFVKELSLLWNYEWKKHQIDVLCACPGPVRSEFHTRASEGHFQQSKAGSISCEEAATLLYQQICKKTALLDIGKRGTLCRLLRLLPRKIRQPLLYWSLQKRVKDSV